MLFFSAHQGVLREIWNIRLQHVSGRTRVEKFIEKDLKPDITEEIADFSTQEFGLYYLQRLQAYFLAPSRGSYVFHFICSWGCYLYIDDEYTCYGGYNR